MQETFVELYFRHCARHYRRNKNENVFDLEQLFSIGGVLPMFRDTFWSSQLGEGSESGRYYWHLMGRGHGCC